MSIQNSNEIKITIGIPVYNGEKFLVEKISSILNLGYDNFELIISDNGSTDSTKKICEEFASKDERIRFFCQEENLGPNWNFDFILKKAKGKYFMWTAVDDKILPGFIEKNISVLEGNDGVVCSISQVKPYGKKTEFLSEKKTVGFFRKIKTLFDTGNYQILDGDSEYYKSPQWKFIIDEEFKTVKLRSKNTTYMIYEYDLEWDHGSYNTIEETNIRLKKYRLYKQVEI